MVCKLVLCELFHPLLHGFIPNVSDPNVLGHYLVITSKKDELDDCLLEYRDNHEFMLETAEPKLFIHPFLRNYLNVIQRSDYIKLELAQIVELSGGERVAILKTFWIRVIQRAWKKVFCKRQSVLNERSKLSSIKHKEVNGKWPQNCSYLPGLSGLLV